MMPEDHNDHNDDHDNHEEKRITATNMVIDPIDCYEPCNAIVTVTWTNTSEKRERFKPAIKVNEEEIELDTEINLDRYDTTTQTFNLTNLMEGVYTICPDPN